jgi:hypothetical protein
MAIPDHELLLDTWAALDFKTKTVARDSRVIADWIGDQRRRMNAYIMLDAYKRNSARYFLDLGVEDEDIRGDRRELGDAQVIVDTIVAGLLGNDVTVVCPDSPDLEKWAQSWAKKVKAVRKMFNAEDQAVGLGDGVIALSWDGVKKRVEMKSYNPGFYFPVLDGASDDEFPTRVNIAWEFIRLNRDKMEETWIRRRTWDLVEVDGRTTCLYSDGEWLLDDLELGDDYDSLPVSKAHWYTNSDGVELDELDLKIDFIPVVHIPNTSSDEDEHFGQSSLATILQIIDEIQATDSDLAKGSSIAGFPPLAADGAIGATVDSEGRNVETYGPGTVFSGHLSTIDTSKSLDALIKYLEKLLNRLAVNSHLPEAVIGRVKPSEVPSGLAFALGFAPMKAMLYRMRLIREEKYPLIFKFAYRLAKAAGAEGLPAEPADEVNWPTFKPGAFLPSDVEATVNIIQKAFMSVPRFMSLQTAIELLIEAGMAIEDAKAEVERIAKENFEGAEHLAAATTDPRTAFEYLGLDVPDDLPQFNVPAPVAVDPNAPTKAKRGPDPGTPQPGAPPPVVT